MLRKYREDGSLEYIHQTCDDGYSHHTYFDKNEVCTKHVEYQDGVITSRQQYHNRKTIEQSLYRDGKLYWRLLVA